MDRMSLQAGHLSENIPLRNITKLLLTKSETHACGISIIKSPVYLVQLVAFIKNMKITQNAVESGFAFGGCQPMLLVLPQFWHCIP